MADEHKPRWSLELQDAADDLRVACSVICERHDLSHNQLLIVLAMVAALFVPRRPEST